MARLFPISGLRSVHLTVPDLAEARRFYTDIWGLALAADEGGALYLRGYGDDPYLLALSEGATAIAEVCWRAAPGTDLAALRDQMIGAGATLEADIAEQGEFCGGTGFALRDPAGRGLRVVQNDARPDAIANVGHMPERLAHVNINCADLDGDIAFYEAGLGMHLTDRSGMMGFLRTNDDHHSIVLADAEVNTLNHVSFNHAHYDEMMRAGGKMCDAGFEIGWGPGRHGPGDNVFFYFVDPFGFVIEHTAEVLQVDDSYPFRGPSDWVWPEGRTDQWGICPPKTSACKAAQLAIEFS